MPETLYQYSQLCCIVETMVFGISLLFIGNGKLKKSSWMKRAKCSIALVLLIVGIFTTLQYSIHMSQDYPKLNTALNINMLYGVTFLLAFAFLPLANKAQNANYKLYPTLLVFLLSGALVWISTFMETSIGAIIRVSSMALYLFELVRITIACIVSFKKLDRNKILLDSENGIRSSYLTMLVECLIAMSLYALLYVFLALWSEKTLAIFNFATLPLWAYLFVTFVNMMINYQPHESESTTQVADIEQNTSLKSEYKKLKTKVNHWISSRGYCRHGVTLNQVAEQLGTNRFYLSRYINDTYGYNFNSWLTRLRIEESKRLLISSPTLSLDKIALKVGFASKSHFMSSFKSIVGTTPGRWREQNWLPLPHPYTKQ